MRRNIYIRWYTSFNYTLVVFVAFVHLYYLLFSLGKHIFACIFFLVINICNLGGGTKQVETCSFNISLALDSVEVFVYSIKDHHHVAIAFFC